jgi:hypothetical protein
MTALIPTYSHLYTKTFGPTVRVIHNFVPKPEQTTILWPTYSHFFVDNSLFFSLFLANVPQKSYPHSYPHSYPQFISCFILLF